MFKHFKYLELTRHHIIKKTKKIFDESNKSDNSNFNQICEVVFSSAMTLFLSFLAELYFSDSQFLEIKFLKSFELPLWAESIIMFIIGIVVYIILFITVKYIYRLISRRWKNFIYQEKHHGPDTSELKIKELIDDFDNITFDHLLIAYDYVDQINVAIDNKNTEVATFYLHETLYYLRTAINKTKEILIENRREQCLNIKRNTRGVDVFRLFNAHRMMEEIYKKIDFLISKNPLEISLYAPDLGDVIRFQINEIKEDITHVGTQCQRALIDLKTEN